MKVIYKKPDLKTVSLLELSQICNVSRVIVADGSETFDVGVSDTEFSW